MHLIELENVTFVMVDLTPIKWAKIGLAHPKTNITFSLFSSFLGVCISNSPPPPLGLYHSQSYFGYMAPSI